MSTTPEQAPHEAALFRTIREWGITRGDNGVVGGVVEGLGDRVGMARVPARLIVVFAAIILNGLVLVAYAAAWALLPDRRGNIIVQNFGRGIPNVGALVGIAILTLFGVGSLDRGSGVTFNGFPWGDSSNWGAARAFVVIFAILVPLLIVGGIVTLIVFLVKRSNAPERAGTPTSATATTSAAAYATPPVASSANNDTPSAPLAGASPAFAAVPVPAYAVPPARHYAPAPPAPPAPPRPPRVPGPGRSFYLMCLAWAAIAAAAAVWMDRTDHLAVHPVIAGAVIFATGLGVIAIAVSLAGRKLGFLGFLTISSLLPLIIIASNADELRTAYADHGGITSGGGITVTVNTSPPVVFDPTLAFGSAYSDVYFNASCYEADWKNLRDSNVYSSVQRLNLASATPLATPAPATAPASKDTTVDITAELTYVTIPRGASITLSGGDNASATVVFADKGFVCDFQTGTGPYMELTKAGAPTTNLVVHDDQYANTIVIQEVAS